MEFIGLNPYKTEFLGSGLAFRLASRLKGQVFEALGSGLAFSLTKKLNPQCRLSPPNCRWTNMPRTTGFGCERIFYLKAKPYSY